MSFYEGLASGVPEKLRGLKLLRRDSQQPKSLRW